MGTMICQACGQSLDIGDRVGRKEDCPFCTADLHACIQCRFYEPGHHNDCRESQAELISEKERANFCGYYEPARKQAGQTKEAKVEADKLWEKMFGSKK